MSDAPVAKGFWAGTHRAIPPEETVSHLAPKLREFGITRVGNVTGLDWVGIPVVMVCRPNGRSLAVSQGKGLTLAAAKASGLMESIELYHAEYIHRPLMLASARQLKRRHRVLDVSRLSSVDRDRYHADIPFLWMEGYDLVSREPVWVPFEAVSADSTGTMRPGAEYFSMNSNGLASGNHLLEAVSHGIAEAVERDATTLWYSQSRNVRCGSRIDLKTVADADCLSLLERYERAALDVYAWEITSNISIPAFLCFITERVMDPSRIVYSSSGMGCHPCRAVALARALTEAAQSRLTLIAASRDDLFRDQYDSDSYQQTDIDFYRGLKPDEGSGRSFHAIPDSQWSTFNEEVDWEVQCLTGAGIDEVVVVDLTDPDFRIPVAKILIPGLEGPRIGGDYQPGIRARRLRAKVS